MKFKYHIDLTEKSIDDFIKGIEEYKKWLEDRTKVLLQRLTDEGYQIATVGFERAQYDGVNDCVVSRDPRGENIRAVVAVGSAALFIEFGTGVTYPDNHPEAGALGMVRGGYGQGKGKQTTWGYYGDPGTNGTVREVTNKGTLVTTHGNPANMPMYDAVKHLKEILPKLAKEVFSG